MGKTFFYKTAQLAVVLVLLTLRLGAVEKSTPPTTKKQEAQSKYSTAIIQCGEIELAASHSSTGYSQVHKKTPVQLWLSAVNEADSAVRSYSLVKRTGKSGNSGHLEHIFPFHYFW